MAQYWREFRRGFRQPGGREQRRGGYDWVYRRGSRPGRDAEFGPDEYGREYGYPGRGGRGRGEYGAEYHERYGGRFGYGREYGPDRAQRGEGRRHRAMGGGRGGERGGFYGGYAGEYGERHGLRERRGGAYYGEDLYGRAEPRVDERYGHTPSSRWPDEGREIRAQREAARRMDDADIRDNVLENLFQDEWVDPDRIDVDVDDGVVRLTGEVDDFMEARYAWDDAWETPGVRGVINHLTVRTDVPHRDMDLPQTAEGVRRRRATRGGR